MNRRRQPSHIARILVCLGLTGAIVAGPAAFGATPTPRRPFSTSAGSALDLVIGRWSPAQRNLFERAAAALGLVSPVAPSQSVIPSADPTGVPTTSPVNAPTPTPTSTPTAAPTPQPPKQLTGIWIGDAELGSRQMSGSAWQRLKATADGDIGSARISDQDNSHNVRTLAVALIYRRTLTATYRAKARDAIMSAVDTQAGGSALALARNLVAYVVAADLINLDGDDDERFRAWLRRVLGERMSEGRTLRQTHEERPNNHGTHAGASRVAVAAYLGDKGELQRAAQVFRGWLGDRTAWASFKFGSTTWQCDPNKPVPVNPAGCTRDGHPIDGVLPDDQRRSGSFSWPPPRANYVYEALQGAIVQAELLSRAGYPAWDWQDKALLRAFTWLHQAAAYPAEGDDQWQPWLVNRRYASSFPAAVPARYGKNMGWTDWTHAG